MSLPFLPGNNFDKKLGAEKFHKSHFFDVCNEQIMQTGPHRPGIGGVPIPGQVIPPKHSDYPKGEGTNAPAWVAYDRQVLYFKAYFQEAVTERRDEQYRIRSCKLYFYLEDDSIQVNEPVMKNAGMPQGTIIRRHRIPKPAPLDDQYYTVQDFNIGNEIILYGKKFKLCDGDQFTKNFLYKLGVRVGEPCEIPINPYTKLREDQAAANEPLRPYERLDNLRQFLDYDKKVLRFDAYWDDTSQMFGDRRDLTLHYFLCDDTVEILEKLPPNSGYTKYPAFLNRNRIPKNGPLPMVKHGDHTARTVLNVFGNGGVDSRWLLDPLKTGAYYEDFYTDADLVIGATINVYGRQVVLADCDDFTKDFYQSKYGVEKFEPIRYKPNPPKPFPRPIPPYSGFGGEEDSLSSCMGLIPKPPTRDFIKFLEKDRMGLESHILRFVAYIDSDSPIDSTRRVIISYYLSDDTVSFYEPPERNNGIIPGDFMERRKLKKLYDWDNMNGTADYYEAKDLYIGARCTFNKFNFIITDCDEYVLRYMEEHADEFPHSNIALILPKIKAAAGDKAKELKELFVKHDSEQTGVAPYGLLREELRKLKILSEHEIMTVGRYYGVKKPEEIDMQLVTAVTQEKLKKGAWEDFNLLLDAFITSDVKAEGALDQQEFHAIVESFKLPCPRDFLVVLENHFAKDGKVKYEEYVNLIDYRSNPVLVVQYPAQPIKFNKNWSGDGDSTPRVVQINYKALFDHLFPAADKPKESKNDV